VCEPQIFFLTILAPYLNTEFGFTPVEIGRFFLIYPVLACVACLSADFIPKWMERRAVMITCLFCSGIGLLISGPAQFLPNTWQLMAVGQGLIGIFNRIPIVVGLPEMTSQANKRWPGQKKWLNN